MTGRELKEGNFSERNHNMTGMIIATPSIKREWLRCLVIPPSCYVHLTSDNCQIIGARTLDFVDLEDERVKLIQNRFGQSYLIPQDVLVERVVGVMNATVTNKKDHVRLYDVNGNCLYQP